MCFAWDLGEVLPTSKIQHCCAPIITKGVRKLKKNVFNPSFSKSVLVFVWMRYSPPILNYFVMKKFSFLFFFSSVLSVNAARTGWEYFSPRKGCAAYYTCAQVTFSSSCTSLTPAKLEGQNFQQVYLWIDIWYTGFWEVTEYDPFFHTWKSLV